MNCLLCGSEKHEVLTELCSNMDIMGPFFHGKSSRIAACSSCGHVYVDIDADQDAFTEYYSSEYSKSLSYFEVFGYEYTKTYYENIAERISRYISGNARILEIGGGIGELADFLREKGFSDITVMEPSPRCLKLCQDRGIPVINSDGMDLIESLREQFDLIIINHTLEHILRFDRILKTARAMLKPEGSIYIEVPDASQYQNTQFVPYWFFTYEHLFHMSLDSFENLAAVFGFEVAEKKSYLKCNSYHVMYGILKKTSVQRKPLYRGTTVDAVRQYIKDCELKLAPVLKKLEHSQESLILWGVGTSTAQLLNGNFDRCRVCKLIDSNPYRQKVSYFVAGRKLPIEDPAAIREEDGTILILPLMYDGSIRRQIEKMGLKNPVISLIEQTEE